MQTGNDPQQERKPPSRACETELTEVLRALTVEQQRYFMREMRQAAEANDNVLPFDEMLRVKEFREEIGALAEAAGIPMIEYSLAVNPNQYPAYSAPSSRCRIDRYLAKTGSVDIRVQVYTRVDFTHRLIPAPFDVHVLDGCVLVERDDVLLRFDAGSVIGVTGKLPITLRAQTGTRFIYANHPMTTWIRTHGYRAAERTPGGSNV